MKTVQAFFALALVAPLAAGCAGRTAPFDEMDQAQVTILRLQGQEVAPPAPMPAAPGAGLPIIPIPGLTPEQQSQVQQGIDQFVKMLPPGTIPPGLLPGQPQQPQQPIQSQLPRYKGFVILAQTPLTDETVKDELLDLFGSEDSFNEQRGQCFFPGMGIVMQSPSRAPVELLVSFQCNQAMGDGFQWPYASNGLTVETSQRLRRVYEQFWGPVPPNGA